MSRMTFFSELNTWTVCRQKWFWSYALGIERKGFEISPTVGSCGHEALSAYFKGQDYKAVVKDWCNKLMERFFYIEDVVDQVDQLGAMVLRIMDRYLEEMDHDWAEVVAVEQPFVLPLTSLGSEKKGLQLETEGLEDAEIRGIFDLIVKDRDGYYWLWEHKWPRVIRPREYVDMDTQIGIYQWAANTLGYPIVGTVYNQLLAKDPTPPKPNINPKGIPGKGVSRAKINCSWEIYAEYCRTFGDNPALYAEEMIPKLAGCKFFERYFIYRSPTELVRFAVQLQNRIESLLQPNQRVFMNESWMLCRGCQYRELCIETLKGGDVTYLINNQYQPRDRAHDQKLLSIDAAGEVE